MVAGRRPWLSPRVLGARLPPPPPLLLLLTLTSPPPPPVPPVRVLKKKTKRKRKRKRRKGHKAWSRIAPPRLTSSVELTAGLHF